MDCGKRSSGRLAQNDRQDSEISPRTPLLARVTDFSVDLPSKEFLRERVQEPVYLAQVEAQRGPTFSRDLELKQLHVKGVFSLYKRSES